MRELCVQCGVLLLCMIFALLSVEARHVGSEKEQHKQLIVTWKAELQPRRQLQASALCPQGCSADGCLADATQGGLRCNKCLNNLVVVKATGLCACVAGLYASGGSCLDCPKGSYCPGGNYSLVAATGMETPGKVDCPGDMTTVGKRSVSMSRCVNNPGTYYSINPTTMAVTAVICPSNTYGPGLKKQRGCVPCPTGFTTAGMVGRSSPSACVVPAGYFLKGPGQVAACPPGEWKEGTGANGNCTKCPVGVTTATAGSTTPDACQVLKPGYYAVSITPSSRAITAAGICPQGFVCPGNVAPVSAFNPSNPTALSATEPSIRPCPSGLWTKDVGATSLDQCMTPPGYFTANGSTQPCPGGSFRADWKVAAEASSCTSCGVGVLADKTDRVTAYNLVNGTAVELPVTTSADDCYIQPGQGLYFNTLQKTWRAKNCTDYSYGVTSRTYGLTPAPCKACPSNMVTSTNATAYNNSAMHYTRNADGTGGFTSVMACVTAAGYGYNGRVAQPCDQGSYNEGGNYGTCKPCGLGTTTTGPGAGKSPRDCKTAAGYAGGALCPVGTYNDNVTSDATSCTPCPEGTTTDKTGSDSVADCKLCRPGYGGPSGATTCPDRCGGVGLQASYGPVGRAVGSPCIPCQDGGQTVGFSFNWGTDNNVFIPRTVSRQGASTALDCVAEFGQYEDGAWYLPLQSDVATIVTSNVSTFADCAALCTAGSTCQFVTYDYRAKTCTVRNGAEVVLEGMPWVGFKALPSGYTATNPWSVRKPSDKHNTSAKAVAGGLYTWWQDPNALVIGQAVVPPRASTFAQAQDCVTACDYDGARCVGVTLEMTVDKLKIGTTCKLIHGDASPGRFKRTVVRTELDRVGFPTSFLCPSGWTGSGEGTSACIPINTPQQLNFVLTAVGTCNATTIQSVKDSLYAFLSDPTAAFGVYTPNLVLEVGCLETDTFQSGYGFRRRLAQADILVNKAAILVLVKFTGEKQPVVTAVQKINEDPCKIDGFCNSIQVVQVLHVTAEVINTTDLVLTLGSYTPGTLKFKTAYIENDVAVPNTAFLLRTNRVETDRGGLGNCTSTVDANIRSWDCVVFIPAGDTIVLSVTVPNTLDPANPITKTLEVTAPGPSPCLTGCVNVANSTGACTPIYGGFNVICSCQTGYGWDPSNGTCALPCSGAPANLAQNTWPQDCKDAMVGHTCTGTCTPGYVRPPTATCVSVALGWQISGGCVPANCSNTLPTVANATWANCADSGVGVVCTGSCNSYYVQSGPISSTCTAVAGGADWATPSAFCGLIDSQAIIAFDADATGGVCVPSATAAVKTSVQAFMASQTGAGGVSVSVSCINADGTSGGSARRLQSTSMTVRYLVVVTYFGSSQAAEALVTAARTDLNQIGTMITSVASATSAVTLQQSGTGDWSGGANTPRNPALEAQLFVMRSGRPTNMQSNTQFFLTAVYTGSTAIPQQGASVTGSIVPSPSVNCTALGAAPVTDTMGVASWSCTTGLVGTAVNISGTVVGTTLSASIGFTIGTDCVGAFGDYGACDNVCGAGNKTRTFSVVTPAANGGRACSYADGYVDTTTCTGPTTCQECYQCNTTGCVQAPLGTICSTSKSCSSGTCSIPCPGAPPALQHNTWPANCTEGLLGDTCMGACDPGYTQPPSATCPSIITGWSTSGGCAPANCSSTLPTVANATWANCADSGVGVSCSATCDSYYVPSAAITSTCTAADGGAVWSTPTTFCGLIDSQAIIAFDANATGGVCVPSVTAAVKASVQAFMASQTGAGGVSVYVSCINADGTSGGSARRLQGASTTVRYLVVVTCFGSSQAAQALVTAARTDLNQIGTMITSVAAATSAITLQQSGTGDWSGGASTPRNPELEAQLFVMRSGSVTNMQSNTQFFVTAVYTGSITISKQGASVTGLIVPSSSVSCIALGAAPVTDANGVASWSCTTGLEGTAVNISGTVAHGGTTLSASIGFTIGTDCVGAFGDYGACDNVCGAGNKTRTFSVATPSANGGRACSYADGYVDTTTCTGPTTCQECYQCNTTGCVEQPAGSNCSNLGNCYDGVCQPGIRLVEVRSIIPFYSRLPYNNTEWMQLRYFTNSTPNSSVILNLSPEVGRSSPAVVNGSLTTTAPTDPRTGSPITSAVRMYSPTNSEYQTVEATVWYINNTFNHPKGLFNGMKFRDFINNNGTLRFSWYRADWTGGGSNGPTIRFTILNPKMVESAAIAGQPGRVDFVWIARWNYPTVPTNTWVTEEVGLNKGKLWMWLGAGSVPSLGYISFQQSTSCQFTLAEWLTPGRNCTACQVSSCSSTLAQQPVPWVKNSTLYQTNDLIGDAIIWEVRVSSLDPMTLFYANNVQLTTSLGHNFTYVFTT